MATLPTPIRAALGLAATAIDEARKLPETLPQLPVAVVGTAMQASLRVQQHIAAYASRGDEFLSQLRGTPDEAPSWATFDDAPASNGTAGNHSPAKAAFELIEDVDAVAEDADAVAQPPAATRAPNEPAGTATAAPAKHVPAKNIPAKNAAARSTPVTSVPAKKAAKAPAKKTAAKKAAVTKAAVTKASDKPVAKKPSTTKPASEPLEVAAERANPTDPPNPSVLAAEIVQAHESTARPGENS